ncbi:MAG: hypothetical protein IPJ86_05990 [Bacteroidetes bacterium]|nr:hypothetical protein [Bacteroidota bacterium]
MVKKLKTLLVVFDNEIKPHEIPAFRGAIIKKVGLDNFLFHNHREDGSVMYQYPVIQYKQIYGKPAIYCLDEGSMKYIRFLDKGIGLLRLVTGNWI